MVRRIDASATLQYHDPRFGLDVTSTAEHRAAGEGYPQFEYGTYETEKEQYQTQFTAARELARAGESFTMSFYVHAARLGRETTAGYRSIVRCARSNGTNELTLELTDERRGENIYLSLPRGKEALDRALALTFGGFLSYCRDFNTTAHDLTTDHMALLNHYDNIVSLRDALPDLFPKELADPVRHNVSIQMQEEDIKSIHTLTSTPWSQTCQAYGLSVEDQFPLFFDIPVEDGYCMRLEFQTESPDLPLQSKLTLFDPADNCVGTIRFSGPGFPFGTHELAHGSAVYALDLGAAFGREYNTHIYDTGIIPGYSPEWHIQVVENAAKAYAKHGAEMLWKAEDALIWAMEDMTHGPDDLPFDLYSELILDVEARCKDVEKTLEFRLSKIKASMEQNEPDPSEPAREPGR